MTVRMLVAYSIAGTNVSTTLAYLNSLSQCTGFKVDYIHVTHGAEIEVPHYNYDVVFHNYCARLCFPEYVSDSYREWLKEFRGLKIVAIQDEYDDTDIVKRNIKDLGFDVVLTCVPQDQLEYVYPKSEFPDVEFITVLTGYVPDGSQAEREIIPLSDRAIKIGYRGNNLSARYGLLGFQKFDIGRQMKIMCEERGIPHDIAMDAESRLYGEAWFEFLGSCRAVLGTESGSNVFDFDGTLVETLNRLQAEKGRPLTYDEFKPYIGSREHEISMGQISPRVFEAATMRTPMILMRGRYSDIIQPNVHYIPLEHDYSNANEVFALLDDIPYLEAMAERAHRDLVVSKRYSYETFGRLIENTVRRKEHILAFARSQSEQTERIKTSESFSANVDSKQRPTKKPLPLSYLNWSIYRDSNRLAKLEIERLWQVFDDLMRHVLLWSTQTSRSYSELHRSLNRWQRNECKLQGLPEHLGQEKLLDIMVQALKLRQVCEAYLAHPLPEDFDPEKALEVCEHEKDRKRTLDSYIQTIPEHIETLQREFNDFYAGSLRLLDRLNEVGTLDQNPPPRQKLRQLSRLFRLYMTNRFA